MNHAITIGGLLLGILALLGMIALSCAIAGQIIRSFA
jgi:hypothetical protein